ncbi:hypothetical protein Pint_06357 [Pistacia integerrima]|uniref:Uncharacterized protein n=1 Tax=Pistacia integerrima TaxID=434235 RepID=A0ACC0Z3Z3_9ROSI|nr:hypothetical protein Pint_06357 [Pistacia integerrima]
MSQVRVDDELKSSKVAFFVERLRPCDVFLLITKIPLMLCLVTSIGFVLYAAFSTQSRAIRFNLPKPKPISLPPDPTPTNISHILFGISGSAATWHHRAHYTSLWWDPDKTRGYAWLDEKPGQNTSSKNKTPPENSVPYKVSDAGWTRFRYTSSRPAVRIARIIWDSFKLNLPNVRWFVMGDDDTVFFTENLVSVLTKYDHNQIWYIGCNSESVEQNEMHSFNMAFGGGGFAVSYPLAEKLVNALDGCLERYYYFYGSDQRIWACISEIGVTLTPERGFHQLDIRGDPYGLLAAHPIAPLVSLHHIDYLNSLFPNRTQIESLETLIHAYRIDPNRILQQSFGYDGKRRWCISISWGYTIQIYPFLVSANNLAMPLQTFKTWRSWSNGPFVFNTRSLSPDPCHNPVVYFLNRAEKVGMTGTRTTYIGPVPKFGHCKNGEYAKASTLKRIIVSSMKMDPEYWHKAPQRQCFEILDGGSIRGEILRIRIRKCRPKEIMAV